MAKGDPERIASKLSLPALRAHVLVCTDGSCASRREQKEALKAARREVKSLRRHRGVGRIVCNEVGCLGICRQGPIAAVWPDGVFYRKATAKNLRRILNEHVVGGRVVDELCIARPETGE
jgi:(2Fe-2S) ferredoxin